jgi:hypothetical protein
MHISSALSTHAANELLRRHAPSDAVSPLSRCEHVHHFRARRAQSLGTRRDVCTPSGSGNSEMTTMPRCDMAPPINAPSTAARGEPEPHLRLCVVANATKVTSTPSMTPFTTQLPRATSSKFQAPSAVLEDGGMTRPRQNARCEA